MIPKTYTYTDYDNVERTETFYFHMEKAEILKMEMGVYGGMKKLLEKIIAEKDSKRLYEQFEALVQKSYGVKSPDGRRFIKNDEVLQDFIQSPAYSMLIMELVTDPDKAAEFTNGIMPRDMVKQ